MKGLKNQSYIGKGMFSIVLSSVLLFSCSKTDLQETSELNGDLLNNVAGSNLSLTAADLSGQLAFPGATGFGKHARGAYAKFNQSLNNADLPKILYVDNLNDSGEGSLRAALTATYPRLVIFRTGGTIAISSDVWIKSPYITIAGNTAPGGGIAIRGGTIGIMTSNVIVRNIRVRHGVWAKPDYGSDGISISANGTKLENILIDHCSVSWAADEQIGINGTKGGVSNITIQNSIIAEGFLGHAFGVLANGKADNTTHITNVSIHRNLFVSHEGRNPRFGQFVTGTVINNLTHNWAAKASEYADGTVGDVLYNKFKAGRNTTSSGKNKAIQVLWDGSTRKSTVHLAGNVNISGSVLQEYPTGSGAASNLSSRPHYSSSTYGFTPITDLTSLESNLLPTVGAFPRDAVDARIVNEYLNASGSIPSAAGTYPTLARGTYPSNNNGVHASWLVKKGYASSESAALGLSAAFLLNPANGKNGYSIVEEFVNDIAPYQTSTSTPVVSEPISSTPETTAPVTNEPITTTPETTTPTSPTTSTAITSFTLVNAGTDKDVMTLTNGATFSISKLGTDKFNIRSNMGTVVGSVLFNLSGPLVYSYADSQLPYALTGDDGKGDYYRLIFKPGTYTLKATPYSDIKARGTAGTTSTISFTVTN